MLSNRILFCLTVLSGLIIFQPDLHYQSIFFQGDHGRDLLAFSMTAKGLTPYRDFFWDYGPLPLYYFALFFKLFGESIRSVLLGEVVLKLAAGMVVFLILRPSRSPIWPFLGGLFFMSFYPYFFHTYSHTIGIVLLLTLILFLVRTIHEPKPAYLYGGLAVLFLMSLTKINVAVVSSIAAGIALFVIQKSGAGCRLDKKFFLTALAVPVAAGAVYLFTMGGLPDYIMRHIFYYSLISKNFFAEPFTNVAWMGQYLVLYLQDHWRNPFLAGLLAFSCGAYFYYFKRVNDERKKQALLSVGLLVLFYISFLHEYVFTGFYYRLFWAAPFLILLLFVGLGTLRQRVLILVIAALVGGLIVSRTHHKYMSFQDHHTPEYYLSSPRAGVFLGNPSSWFKTVDGTIATLEPLLKEGEPLFCLPYDAIYYFLLDRPSPVYPVAFFDYMNFSDELERDVILGLEDQHVNWIVMSNSIFSDADGKGIFGITNSKVLANYIGTHFEIFKEFGDWTNPPGITSNHAVRILRRVNASDPAAPIAPGK